MNNKKVFILYPCGKKFEIRVPITVVNDDGSTIVAMPGSENYLFHAQKKFQINNLKVIEEEVNLPINKTIAHFVSLVRTKRAID